MFCLITMPFTILNTDHTNIAAIFATHSHCWNYNELVSCDCLCSSHRNKWRTETTRSASIIKQYTELRSYTFCLDNFIFRLIRNWNTENRILRSLKPRLSFVGLFLFMDDVTMSIIIYYAEILETLNIGDGWASLLLCAHPPSPILSSPNKNLLKELTELCKGTSIWRLLVLHQNRHCKDVLNNGHSTPTLTETKNIQQRTRFQLSLFKLLAK